MSPQRTTFGGVPVDADTQAFLNMVQYTLPRAMKRQMWAAAGISVFLLLLAIAVYRLPGNTTTMPLILLFLGATATFTGLRLDTLKDWPSNWIWELYDSGPLNRELRKAAGELFAALPNARYSIATFGRYELLLVIRDGEWHACFGHDGHKLFHPIAEVKKYYFRLR